MVNPQLVLLLLEYEFSMTCHASLYSTFSLCLCLTPSSICWSSSSSTWGTGRQSISYGETWGDRYFIWKDNRHACDSECELAIYCKGFGRCDGAFPWCSVSSPGYSWWELQHPATETPTFATFGKLGERTGLKFKWAVSKDEVSATLSSCATTCLTSLAS